MLTILACLFLKSSDAVGSRHFVAPPAFLLGTISVQGLLPLQPAFAG